VSNLLGNIVGIQVWSWEFVVEVAAELKVVPGSVQRESIGAHGAGAGQPGNSVNALYEMYVHNCVLAEFCTNNFHLGAIAHVEFEGCGDDACAQWTYTIDGAPTGFLISPSTGEIQGNPQSITPTAVTIRILAQDQIGRVVVVEQFQLKVHEVDVGPDANGPNGMACNAKGTTRLVDDTLFDGKFTCECVHGVAGDNCETNLHTRDHTLGKGARKILAGAFGAATLIAILIGAGYHIHRYKIKNAPVDFTDLQLSQRPREIPRERVTLLKRVGSGAFGEVWKASLHDNRQNNTVVAVKLVKLRNERKSSCKGPPASIEDLSYEVKLQQSNNELIAEAKIMASVGYHENVLSIVGVSTRGCPKMLIVAYCEHGSLLHVLKKEEEFGRFSFSPRGKLVLALGVLRGMAHLISNRVVHRDVAARNVLLGSTDTTLNGMVPRVADFGLSRVSKIDTSKDYYRSIAGVFPIRWTSPEAMTTLKFTEASDVWSFGILLIEIFQNGSRPFSGMSNEEVYAFTVGGGKHWQPDGCSDGVYAVMVQCWEEVEKNRPNFATLVAAFTGLTRRRSEDSMFHFESGGGGAAPMRDSGANDLDSAYQYGSSPHGRHFQRQDLEQKEALYHYAPSVATTSIV
jgi:serine/threonine protein kinase